MYARQEARAPMAETYWRMAGARPGFRVAEVGAGPGFFALRYAAFTGPTGHVHATDVSPDALDFLRARLDPVHHAHVTTELLDIQRAPLPDLGFHAVFATDMLHHVDDVPAALASLRQTAAPLVIAEFDPAGPGEDGPPLSERLAPRALHAMLEDAGWRAGKAEALPYEHYALVATPR